METVKSMTARLAVRTVILAFLTLLAFSTMQELTIFTGWPELMGGLGAAAKVAWAEVSIMWIRIVLAPRLDVQHIVKRIESGTNYMAMAVVYGVYQLTWALRIGAFLYFGWVL